MAIKQKIWTTELVEDAKEGILNGFTPSRKDSPYDENRLGIRKSGAAFSMSDDEIEEYTKSYMDLFHFAQNYCFVKGEDGKHNIIKLRKYQYDILQMYLENRFSILLASRQVGKSICTAIFILHYILFNNKKNILISANKWETIYELIDKIKEIYSNLPYFLQKGITTWNQRTIAFENKSRIRTATVGKSAGVGQSVDLLYVDEAAIPDDKIQRKFYLAVYPTISSIENSKIILTSTPRGYNLFSELLFDSERPDGDPQKNPYASMRVYWYSVPSRFCTYVRLSNDKMYEFGFNEIEIYEQLKSMYGDKKTHQDGTIEGVELYHNTELRKWVINCYNNDHCREEDIPMVEFNGKHLLEFSEITTWKKEAIKGIGGEDAFNQEFGLQFVTANRSLLSEKLIDDLNRNQKDFDYMQIDVLNNKLRFNWSDLKWNTDETIFHFAKRLEYKIIISIDLSEGLGGDYSVINIFKVSPKRDEHIDLWKESFNKLSDFFCLEQIGMYRSNVTSVQQMSELLYCIVYDIFDPENVKVVLEMNSGGGEMLAHMPKVFNETNNYGSSIFFKYKHRQDAEEEKIGFKVTGDKKYQVRDYQDCMQRRDIMVYEHNNIRELTTFVKHETNAGNIRYASDGGNDDTTMTIVNLTTVFNKSHFFYMVEEEFVKMPITFQNIVNEVLKTKDFSAGTDYKTFTNSARKVRALSNNSWGNSYYNRGKQ